MDSTVDHYATLGIDPTADGAAIRAAYRSLMRRYHPDVNGSEDAAVRATTINEAYACLGDADKRAAYDQLRAAEQASRATASTYRPRSRPHSQHAQYARWHQHRTFAVPPEPEPQPTRWKVLSLGLAGLVTLITFALTASTSPVSAPASPQEMIFATSLPEEPAAQKGTSELDGAIADHD